MVNIPIRDIVATGTPSGSSEIAFDDGQMKRGTVASIADAVRPVASQSEAQVGTNNTKTMTPLRVKESFTAEIGVTIQGYSAVLAGFAGKTVPSGAVVGTSDAQTLTNKTITSPLGIVKGDVGLGNVDNTSDANKPVSTLQAAALALKADTSALALKANLASPTFTGFPLAPTAGIGTNTTQIATTAFVLANSVAGSAPYDFETVAAVAAATISAPVIYLRTAGYSAVGDTGGALYIRVGSEPSHEGKIQSANGVWFELAEAEPNIKMFGAVGGGTADDTQAAEDCVAYCVAKGLGKMHIGAGTWAMSLVVLASGLNIEGKGKLTVILNNSTSNGAIVFGDGTNTYNANGLRNVLLAQSSSVVPDGVFNKGLWLRKQNTFVLEDIFVSPFPSAVTDGIIIKDCYDVHAKNLFAGTTGRDGIVTESSINVFLDDMQAAVCGRAGLTFVGPSAGIYVNRAESLQNLKGIVISNGPGANDLNQDFFFSQVLGDGNKSNNWEIYQLASGHFSQCWGCTQFDLTTDPAACGWLIVGSNSRNLRFVDCQGNNNNGNGWQIQDIGTGMPSEIYWTNCEFGNNDTTPYLGGPPTPRGNGKAGAGYGLTIANSTERFVVMGGTAMNNTSGALSTGTQTKLIVEKLVGYNPVGLSSVTVGASPFSYVNGPTRTTLYIVLGTVSDIKIDGTGVLISTDKIVTLEPNQVCTVTYSSQPVITQQKH